MFAEVVLVVAGIAALYLGAEWLVKGSTRLARSLGVSPIVAGLTVVALGTSAPELVVAIVAALRGSGDLAVGNVMGSNLANIGLILGITAVITPLKVSDRAVRREVPIMLAVTLLVYPILQDLRLDRQDGLILLGMLATYLAFAFYTGEGEKTDEERGQEEDRVPITMLKDLGLIAAGAIGLMLGGQSLVEGAVLVARDFGISEVVIGLSVVAIGTSLPELATSLTAALKGECDIAVGNVIGSNIFNLAAVLGVASLVRPFDVAASVMTRQLPAVIALSIFAFPLLRSHNVISRREGIFLLMGYVGLGVWVIVF